MAWFRVFFVYWALITSTTAAWAAVDPNFWDRDPANLASLTIEPVRATAISYDGLKLALKHYPRPGAQPVLLIHGLSQGFDVWIGNMRNAGTPGFRSETPDGPHHWTVEDYSINDIPSLIDRVRNDTGQAPFLIAHSLGAWALEGYLAGLKYDPSGRVVAQSRIGFSRQNRIRGLITIAGVYNLQWDHPLEEASRNPLLSADDFYHSNYELELLAAMKPLYRVVPNLPALPLSWINSILSLPVDRIPFIGDRLKSLYQNLQLNLISTPLLSMFYYFPNSDSEMVRQHAIDGLEDLGPHLVEQLANAVNDKRTTTYYHVDRPQDAYDYGTVRKHLELPLLFVAGGRDRLASDLEIYQDGYVASEARDKQFLHAHDFGHLDILCGIHAPKEVMTPVAEWMHARM
jgi:pimeloyl-ACP methyl ester carboxylesterase